MVVAEVVRQAANVDLWQIVEPSCQRKRRGRKTYFELECNTVHFEDKEEIERGLRHFVVLPAAAYRKKSIVGDPRSWLLLSSSVVVVGSRLVPPLHFRHR